MLHSAGCTLITKVENSLRLLVGEEKEFSGKKTQLRLLCSYYFSFFLVGKKLAKNFGNNVTRTI